MSFETHELAQIAGSGSWMNYANIKPQDTTWIAFSINSIGAHCGIGCTATMDDGSMLHGHFDESNKALFLAVSGTTCVKIEFDGFDQSRPESSVASTLLKIITG